MRKDDIRDLDSFKAKINFLNENFLQKIKKIREKNRKIEIEKIRKDLK